MITVKLNGGLGNQLFQYATGRALSLQNHDELTLDISTFEAMDPRDTPRKYALAPFAIHGRIAAKSASSSKLLDRLKCIVRKLDLRLHEYYTPFYRDTLARNGDILLEGYFQSEKYFEAYRDYIIKDLHPKQLSDVTRRVKELILKESSSISLHVRRGDYVDNPIAAITHGLCGLDYYDRAKKFIANSTTSPRYFVFSDDIAWAKSNLILPDDTVFVSSPGIADYEELYLMSLCKHQIIANSSFSWWGAWLNTNPNKIVIAPRQWTLKHSKWHRDTVPNSWTRL